MTEVRAVDLARADAVLDRINQLLQAKGIAPAQLEPSGGDKALRVKLAGSSQSWTIDIECPPQLNRLPSVWLVEPKRMLLAHVAHYGAICINDGQGLSMDAARQDDIVAHAVLDAYDLLERSDVDAKSGYIEFFNELEGYWSGLSDITRGRTSVRIIGTSRLINGYYGKDEDAYPCWYFTERPTKVAPPEFRIKNLKDVLGMYIPLGQGILPPAPEDALTTGFLLDVIDTLDADGRKVWSRLVKNRSTKVPRLAFILISVPRSAGGHSFIAATFHLKAGAVDTSKRPKPVSLVRHTVEFMRERGGADLSVTAKQIAVLGCGSVGSEVASALASGGVGRLILVDTDKMTVENVFRHYAGRDTIGSYKVHAVASELVRHFPGLTVHPVPNLAEKWIASKDLAVADGIVIAIGQPTVERHIIRMLRAAKVTCPVVITWLEPLDLGGHAVGFSMSDEGCLDCLYRDESGAPSLFPRVSFLAAGQTVTKNLTGCASTFIPYGVVQSRRTALLAAEMMLDLLRGEPAPIYRYWVGSGKVAAREGLRTTAWFDNARRADEEKVSQLLFSEPCLSCRKSV